MKPLLFALLLTTAQICTPAFAADSNTAEINAEVEAETEVNAEAEAAATTQTTTPENPAAEEPAKADINALDIALYAYATAETQKNGAIFGTLENASGGTLSIIEANSDVAATVELHTHTMDEASGVMMMRPVDQYDVEANNRLTLEPSGNHIMLMGLSKVLTEGETFPLTLVFENGDKKETEVRIIQAGGRPAQTTDVPADADTDAAPSATQGEAPTGDHSDHAH